MHFIQHNWKRKANWSPDDWNLGLFVFIEESPIGIIKMASNCFNKSRTIRSGSWRSPEYRGLGIGREMRGAAVGFAFSRLGALECRSTATLDNVPSNRISLSLGYKKDGTESVHGRSDGIRHLLTRKNWKDDVKISVYGLECKSMFGI